MKGFDIEIILVILVLCFRPRGQRCIYTYIIHIVRAELHVSIVIFLFFFHQYRQLISSSTKNCINLQWCRHELNKKCVLRYNFKEEFIL